MRLLCIFLLVGCSEPEKLSVIAGADTMDAAKEFAVGLPLQVLASGEGVALSIDLDCGDCFQVEVLDARRARVHGGNLLGVQYGLAQLLEDMGFRFFHPRRIHQPSQLKLPPPSTGKIQTPEKSLRGVHLHTLHPIEAYWEIWESGDGYKAIIDWLIKNRGNYLEWSALDDNDRVRDHTKAIVDYAHARGITVGIGVELFDSGNLQNAYDLIKSADLMGDTQSEATARLRPWTDLSFDKLSLSFGEFFGAEPDVFVHQVNVAYDALQSLKPGMEMTALIHVGNRPEQHVQYMGMDLLYYFLVQYANPAIVPWIHSVMYYNLFEDTNGAYNHSDFSLHRQYLTDRINAGRPAAYQPESAYWVSFDNPIPQYLPIYMYSRWLDIDRLGPPLKQHVEFSSGWEWGYWQNDYLTLRTCFAERPFNDAVEEMLAPYGNSVATQIESLAMLQHDALITQKLAPYLAGDDFLLEAAFNSGFTSQPHRLSFADALATPDFETTILQPLEAYASAVAQLHIDDSDDPFLAEMHDGLAIDAARAKYISALYRAVISHGDSSTSLAAADSALADAKKIIARRDAHIDQRLLVEGTNSTIYHYGYLFYADTMCYWQRERVQASNAITGASDEPPGCVLGF